MIFGWQHFSNSFCINILIINIYYFNYEVVESVSTESNMPRKDNSALLARIKQLRKSSELIGQKWNTRTNPKRSTTKNAKPKRYKCFLVEDDPQELFNQHNSYFAGFQQRSKVGRNEDSEESPKRAHQQNSDGHASSSRYFYSPTKSTSPATASPIIEYIDDDYADEEEEEQRSTVAADTMPPTPSTPTRAVHTLAPRQKFSNRLKGPAGSAQSNRQTGVVDQGLAQKLMKLSNAQIKRIPQSHHSRIDSVKKLLGKTIPTEDSDSLEEYTDDNQGDLYIGTTRRPFVPLTMSTTLRVQPHTPKVETIVDTVANRVIDKPDKLRQLIPDVKIKASMRPSPNNELPPRAIPHSAAERDNSNEEIENENIEEENKMAERLSKEMQQQAQLVRITAPRKIADAMHASQLHAVQEAPRDAQGRPLILSPEHCKMVHGYSRMYGVQDVRAFVRNNCAFAKMYLPQATCAEIDILVDSCFQPRTDVQKRAKN